MHSMKSDEELITTIEKFGLTSEEALIYYTLVKYGEKGAIVKELVRETSIGRTTIYAILDRLIKRSCVIEGGPSNTAKKATLFIAIEPTRFFAGIIAQKRRDLEELEELNLLHHDFYQKLFQRGIEFTYETLDPFIKPYLKQLVLDKGWMVASQIVEKGMETFGCNVYACELLASKTDSGEYDYKNTAYLIIYQFNYDIEENETSRKFFINLARRKTRDNIMSKGELKEVQLKDGRIKLLKRTWPAFLTNIKVGQEFIEVGKIPILPIQNKLLFLSAGTMKNLKTLAQAVYEVEKLPLANS